MERFTKFLLLLIPIMFYGCNKKPHIVFVIGDEEYRSEESLPLLATMAKNNLGARVTLCFPLDQNGIIDPNRLDHISGLEALATADLMVMFTRFRALPNEELQHIQRYAESGRPIVGFRTSTHAFLFKDEKDSANFYMNNEWPMKVFGQKWITHHGHFEDGNKPLTAVDIITSENTHPILKGVREFLAYSWLYHVDGEDDQLYGDSRPILTGTALRSTHVEKGNDDKYPMTNPVAWTKTYTLNSGKTGRVFFTTLGHPYDFREESMRRLALQGIYWALGKENIIPEKGLNADLPYPYNPNNSGFGLKFKPNQRPPDI